MIFGVAHADSYSDTISFFKNARESASFFQKCYGYAVLPTVGKAGLTVGRGLWKGACLRAGQARPRCNHEPANFGHSGAASYKEISANGANRPVASMA
jgi:hypothetical protein